MILRLLLDPVGWSSRMAIDARHFFAISNTGGLITSGISHLISNLRSFLDLPSEFDPDRIYRKGEVMQIVASKRHYHPSIALLVGPLTATVFPQVPFVFFFFPHRLAPGRGVPLPLV